ncbi:hypothetical protein BGZ46_002323 [Entomortierella lignicola]|nr:hypothetical protein BGZ46_002323 [Entomortierella lignicola]
MTFCDAEGWTVFSSSRAMDFTLCFQNSPLYHPRINKVVGKGHLEGVKASIWFYLKMLLILASVGIQVVLLAEIISQGYYSSAVLSTVVYLVAIISASILHYFEHFNIANPSAFLLVFWLTTTAISIFSTRSLIQESSDSLSSSLPLLKLLFTIVSFLIFILENIPKPNRTSLALGYSFLGAAFPRLLYIAVYYARPILSTNLILFISTYSGAEGVTPQPAWLGFGLLIAVFSLGFLSTLFNNQYLFIGYNASIRARAVLVSLIYRKALHLSSTDKQEGMGSIVNHMSADVDSVMLFFNMGHLSWSSIVEVVVALILLYNEVKYAMFASVGAIIVLLGFISVIAPNISNSQKEMMKMSDKRMKLMNELVTYIKSINLYAWEPYFTNKIIKVRAKQLGQLRRFFKWILVVISISNAFIPLCIFATLSVYPAIATVEEPLDTRRIFTAITIINVLEDPIGAMFNSIQTVFTGAVAYGRIRDFLNSEEINPDNVVRGPDSTSEIAYEVTDGIFGWYSPKAIESFIAKKKKEADEKVKAEAITAKKNKSGKKSKELSGTEDEKTEVDVMDEKSEKDVKEESKDESDSTSENTSDSMGPVLHNINLTIRRGSLTLVVGRVGEGKSSLVSALLGEMYKYSGTVQSFGSLAYVSQSAWISNETVRNNILFGRDFDKQRYLDTIRACALVPDFKMLVSVDKTVIGEKGINLSGGQKQRISIARAVYVNTDIYIFDDPLSAVDAHVDEHIFKNALKTILANKTRILVTNGVNHLKDADQIVVVKQGRIVEDARYDELILNEKGDLFRLVQESKLIAPKDESETSSDIVANTGVDDDEDYSSENSGNEGTIDVTAEKEETIKCPTLKRGNSSAIKEEYIELDESDEINEEIKAEGAVDWPVYKYYLSTLGMFGIFALVIASAACVGFNVAISLWQGEWGADNNAAAAASIIAGHTIQPDHPTVHWIITYFAWAIASIVTLGFVAGVTFLVLSYKASKKFHLAMLNPLVRSPMSLFDVTSSGKIINRFAHDIAAIDLDLPSEMFQCVLVCFSALQIFGFCVGASRYFLIFLVPLSFLYYTLGGYFLVSGRELKRLDSAARSPLYAHFGETLAGLSTIRAFSDADRFAVQATALLDRSQQTSYLTNVSNRWLQLMLDSLSVLVTSAVVLLAILQRETANQQIFSIVLSQINQLTLFMSQILISSVSIETLVVSVERIREYTQLTPETPDYSLPRRIGFGSQGCECHCHGGERVGIVGHTGAGKSSVALALFRIVEAAKGSIMIDGIDVSTLGLQELRSHLTIIPQDPFLFGDSIRANLDPFNKHTDANIWAALESASLKTYVQSLPEGISSTIDNGGENMSLGQRQLMSLARAMLS